MPLCGQRLRNRTSKPANVLYETNIPAIASTPGIDPRYPPSATEWLDSLLPESALSGSTTNPTRLLLSRDTRYPQVRQNE